jgi:hypothetical protein
MCVALPAPSGVEGSLCSCPVCLVPACVIAFNDRRALGAVFGVGIASIGILPTSATVYGATIMLSPRIHGVATLDLRQGGLGLSPLCGCFMR